MKLEINDAVLAIRAAGIIKYKDFVLLHKSKTDQFWSLMGGGVEILEKTQDAMLREVKEELGIDCSIDRLAFVVENFFLFNEQKWHEIGFYYLLNADHKILNPDIDMTPKAKESDLVFKWFHLDEIDSLTLYPEFLKEKLKCIGGNIEHVVTDELLK